LENYIKSKDLPYTILRPASFNENFLNPEITKRLDKGKLVMPLNKDVTQQFISTDDIGKIAAEVLTRPENYLNKTISIATDQKQMTEVAALFGQAMNRDIKYQKLPGFITRLLMGKDLSKMFRYMNKNNFVVVEDIDRIKQEFKGLGDLKSWIDQNFEA
ncbi:MAG: NmrA family NAD(P)-binding protein, partial [Bacteroidia bacterium]|nr:NmrA family NAD(P)-binding protein [Bacteroidia bacterium]